MKHRFRCQRARTLLSSSMEKMAVEVWPCCNGKNQATPASAPSLRQPVAQTPGPLPLLGLAAAFKTSRNVRRRLQSRLG